MKFKVTGGEDGTLGIDVGNRRYEAGDVLEMTSSKAEWLVELGLLVQDGKASKDEPVEEPAEEPVEEPAVEEVVDEQSANLEGDDL